MATDRCPAEPRQHARLASLQPRVLRRHGGLPAIAGLVVGSLLATAPCIAADAPPSPVPPSPVQFNRVTYMFQTGVPLTEEARRYQVIVMQATDAAYVARLHQANPRLIVLVYQNTNVSSITDPHGNTVCTDYETDVVEHPDWLLLDQEGRQVTVNGYPAQYRMDVANPAYQQACAAHAVAVAEAGGFNGVFFDDGSMTNRYQLDPGVVLSKYPTDRDWQAAKYQEIQYLAARVHAAGLLDFLNISGSTLYPDLWEKWLAPIDGAMQEAWTDSSADNPWEPVSDWRIKLAQAAWAQAHGKYMLLHTYSPTLAANLFGLASMLLVADGRLSDSTSNQNYTSAENFFPEYANAELLGAPAGRYVRLPNGVYERSFAHGIVAVNPTRRSIRESRRRGDSHVGPSASGKVFHGRALSLPATSGVILVSHGRRRRERRAVENQPAATVLGGSRVVWGPAARWPADGPL